MITCTVRNKYGVVRRFGSILIVFLNSSLFWKI